MDEVALLKPKLTRLKLAGMLDTLTERLQQAMAEKWSYTQLLDTLLTDEVERREFKQLARRLSKSGLAPDKTLETFDFTFNPTIHAPTLRELATCRFVERAENVFLVGPSGVGKSHAAQALGHVACRKGYEVTYERTGVLFDWLHAGRGDGSYARRLRQVATVALLILDLSRACDYPDGVRGVDGPSRVGCRGDRDNPAAFLDPLTGGAVCSGRRRTDGNAVMEERSWAAGPVCGRVPGSALGDGSFSGLSEALPGVDGPVESLAYGRGSRRRGAHVGSCPAVPGSSTRGWPTASADARVIDAAVRLPAGVECSCSGSGS